MTDAIITRQQWSSMRHFAACDVKGRYSPFSGTDMRANVNVARKQRHTLTLGNFKGVDLSASPLRVSTSRASYMRNLWSENGANHKRPGWRELLQFSAKINGLFLFEEDGEKKLFVHAGTNLYVVYLNGEEFGVDVSYADDFAYKLSDNPTQFFCRGGSIYIVGGGQYLVYDKEHGVRHVSSIAYVPTTTISIGQNGVTDSQRATLEDANLLTRRRKNVLDPPVESVATYKLDSGVVHGSYVYVWADINNIRIPDEDDPTLLNTYSGKLAFRANSVDEERDGIGTRSELYDNGSNIKKTMYDGTELHASFDYFKSLYGLKFNVNTDGLVYIKLPCSSLEIEFEADVARGNAKIENCGFGVLFDSDGGSDRLFLSGNPEEPGVDRWSAAGDFTYFPDGNAMVVGDGGRQITGYARLSDGALAVFKAESAGQPSVYYRTAAKTTMTDSDGYTATVDYFPVKAGVASDGLVTSRASATLSGDPLILTRNGVFGVELSQNVASSERYTKERSYAINAELRKKDLSNAVAIVYRGRYYLATGDGKCYVADERCKGNFDGSTDINYEWWIWDNVPATCFAEYDGKLLFGTADGRICAFEEGIFEDRFDVNVYEGDVRFYPDKEYAVYNEALTDIAAGDKFHTSYGVYEITDVDAAQSHFSMCADASQLPLTVGDDLNVFDAFYNGGMLIENDKYKVITVSEEQGYADLQAIRAKETPSNGSKLCTGRGVYEVIGVEQSEGTLVLRIGLAPVLPPEINLSGYMECKRTVIAEWASGVMDLGTSTARKTLLSLGVTLEPDAQGVTQISLETRDGIQQFRAQNGHNFDFGELDLGDFSFVGNFAASTTMRTNLRNFNFIQVRMLSDTPTDMAVSGVALEYKINQTNRGYY